MLNRLPMLFTSVAIGIVFAGAALTMIGSQAKARTMPPAGGGFSVSTVPNAKIQSLLKDVAEAAKPSAGQISETLKKTRAMVQSSELRTGADFLVASMIMAKGETKEDALLSHDLAMCAMSMNESRAKEWAAYSQDQFLARIGQKQRYGTQVRDGQIVPTTNEVPDTIRFILGLPSLVDAKRRAFDLDLADKRPGLSQAAAAVAGVQ